MLKHLHIRNYRIFNELKMKRLDRINLITGKNNSGKTALLEAIFLLSGGGNPEMALNAHVIRGPNQGLPTHQTIGETFWKPMFSALDTSRSVKIAGHHDSHGPLTLTVTSEWQETIELPLEGPGGDPGIDLPDRRSLVFQYIGPGGKEVKGRIRVKRQGFDLKQGDLDVPFLAAIVEHRVENTQEDAMRLGKLRRQKQGHVLLKALQVIEPKLQNIEDNSASGTPMIWGDVGLPELIPLLAMGEGMTRIARIVLSVAGTPNGVILVDEIETGLHHSVLPDVWKVIDATAKQFNVQIFATTHSFECVGAAHQSLGAKGFLLHRLEANGTENRCVTYEPEALTVALQHPLEIR